MHSPLPNTFTKQSSDDKASFTAAYHKLLELQNTNQLHNSTAHVFDLIQANGTLYSVIDVNEGQTFELDKSKKIYVMCQSAYRSYVATRILVQNGFDAYNYSGGYRLYSSIYNDEVMSKESFPCGMDK